MTTEQIEDAVFEVLDEVRTGRTEACAQITAYIVGLLAAERADEREACAKIADQENEWATGEYAMACESILMAIRARGTK